MESSDCGILYLSKELIQEITAYLGYEPKRRTENILSWHNTMEGLLSKPTILLKRERGLGDVLAFEPCARKLKKM